MFYIKRGISVQKIPRQCGFWRILAAWEQRTDVAPDGYIAPTLSLKGTPMPYEVQYHLDNASDCADWYEDNKEALAQKVSEIFIPEMKNFVDKLVESGTVAA